MPRSFRRPSSKPLALLVAALGLTLSAATPAVKPKTHPPKTHPVVMEAVRFRPAALTVRTGDSVIWANRDPFPHTATSPVFESKVLPPGQSWRYVANVRGEFPYVCTLHPTMKGTLRVE
jgi:plastocyanin